MPQPIIENPVKMTPEVVKKLEEAFSIDSTVQEACFYANISKQTYYNWVNSDAKLKERFDSLREKPVLLARQTVVKKISESYSNAMDYLSRKKKGEFSLRQEVTGADGEALNVSVVTYGHNSTPELPAEGLPASSTESD